MGYKKKWNDTSSERLTEHLEQVYEITKPLFQKNGRITLPSLDNIGNLEYRLALILNCKFASSDDKNDRRFGADDVIAIQLEIENNDLLKYWGKINWLSKPNNHICHNAYQDPFFGIFKLESNQISIVKAMFGDYDKTDLDGQNWVESKVNWMYDL